MSFDSEKYSKTIQGTSANEAPDHYEMDKMLEKKFGSEVEVDSEQGTFFAYVTAESADEVFAYVKEIGLDGGTYDTYGAGSFPAEFRMYDT